MIKTKYDVTLSQFPTVLDNISFKSEYSETERSGEKGDDTVDNPGTEFTEELIISVLPVCLSD